MGDPEDTGSREIGEAEREADQEIEELEREGDEMEERLDASGAEADEVNVPEPGEAPSPGLDETDIPEGEGESAEEAGQ